MPDSPPTELLERLAAHKQEHLLSWWEELDAAAREELVAHIEAVDFDEIERLLAADDESDADETPEARARRANRPRDLVRLPHTETDTAERQQAARRGEELLAAGKVGVILVAGGQGTRLGFDHPKGMFPLGPVSGNTLYQMLIEQAVARTQRAGVTIPYYVMTSDATHEETVAFLQQHDYFGLQADAVRFFRQGNMPAVDAATGKLLLAEKSRLALSPDGHGGMLAALGKAGLLEELHSRGVEYLYYHQVDNPLSVVCDPVFLGLHAGHEAEMSTKVVAKRLAKERMGIVVEVDGKTQIIEYSDLPDDVARLRDESGELLHWSGSTAIHVFNREFLDRLSQDDLALPFHRAVKKVDCIDAKGKPLQPGKPNACKFERFIFDALPQAKRALVLEADRASEFSPVKNAEGDDSPETARREMSRLFAGWLRQAGAVFPDDVAVEISPLFALDAEELCRKLLPGTHFDEPVNLRE